MVELEIEVTVVDESTREARVIFEDPTRYARQSVLSEPYLDTLGMIKEKYGVKRAIDFGCGLGIDVYYMRQVGIGAVGFDGSEAIRPHFLCKPSLYHVVDLRHNIKVKGGADMIHCREVAEHMPIRFSEILIRNIIRNGRVTYFTAAPPGQRGSGHINCQYKPFWLALFFKYGWTLDQALTNYNSQHNTNSLDRNNGMVISGQWRPQLKMT